MIRSSFVTKYSDLASRWGIDHAAVSEILHRYDELFALTMASLSRDKMLLPKHFRDNRTDEEFIYDVMDGWALEDIICYAWLRPALLKIDPTAEIRITGTDADRVIQKYNPYAITTKPDFMVNMQGLETTIELQMARTELADGYDMKVPKVNRALQTGSLFLWVIIPADTWFIIDPQKEMAGSEPQPNPKWGGKMVYHITQEFIARTGGYSRMDQGINDRFSSRLQR
jgi:hypothetical protein